MNSYNPEAMPTQEDDKNLEEAKEKAPEPESQIDKMDQIFDELLDEVKDAPEAKKEALKVLISQIQQVGEQIKQVRDMRHLQELKKLMVKHWKELNELTEGDPTLLKKIQGWGEKFIEEKVIFYDMINEVKDELIDKSQEIQEKWNDMQVHLGKAVGMIGEVHEFEAQNVVKEELEKKRIVLDEESIASGKWKEKGSGIELFIVSLNQAITGFTEDDIDVKQANLFLEGLNIAIRKLSVLAYKKGVNKESPVKNDPELKAVLTKLTELAKEVSASIKEASQIYKVTKKIRDTHFLPLYNQ